MGSWGNEIDMHLVHHSNIPLSIISTAFAHAPRPRTPLIHRFLTVKITRAGGY
jgi:hypothetical protein